MMKKVRAKFEVTSVEDHYEQRTVRLMPVYSEDPDHENKKFWDATPCGDFSMTVNNVEAVSDFEVGQEYYIDLIPAADKS